MNKNKKGFTLVELMIVITVIAILATIGVMSFTRVQKQARDTRRKGDLRALYTALQAYYTENQFSYPAALSTLVPIFVPNVPLDPIPAQSYGYSYGTYSYSLCAQTETGGATYWVVSTLNPGGYTSNTCKAAE